MSGMRSWRFISDASGSAAWNMAVDEALYLEADVPTLRLYSWEHPAWSLGYRQPVPEWIGRCLELGVEAVRRVTGGGSVLHYDDLTYSITLPAEAPGFLETRDGAFNWIQKILLSGIHEFGLDAEPSVEEPGADRAEFCFARSTGNEIAIVGTKFVGSAQRRGRHGLLQHGSIRLCEDRELYRQLTGSDPGPSARLMGIDRELLKKALFGAFASAVNNEYQWCSLSDAERNCAQGRVRLRDQDPLGRVDFL